MQLNIIWDKKYQSTAFSIRKIVEYKNTVQMSCDKPCMLSSNLRSDT